VIILAASVAASILWYRQTQRILRETNLHLRHFMAESNRIKQATRGYSVDDKEPFGLRVEELLRQLGALENEVAELHKQYGEIQTSMHAFESRNWFIILSSPLRWYRIQKQLSVLRKTILTSLSVLKVTENVAKQLTRQGWYIAQQARQMLEEARQIKTEMFHLRRKRLRGQLIELTFEMEKNLHEELGQIPLYFLSAGEDTFMQQASKSDITRVYQILKNARATMTELHTKAQDWQQTHTKALEQTIESQQLIHEMKTSLNNKPNGLDLTASTVHFTDLESRHKKLLADISSPEAEQLPALTRQIQRLHREIQQEHRQRANAIKEFSDFQTLLSRLNQSLAELTKRFDELESAPEYPILWGNSRQSLLEIKKSFNTINYSGSLGAAPTMRTPEVVETHLTTAQDLDVRCNELARSIEKSAGQRTELLGLLASPALQQQADWFRNAQALAVQVAVYNPANWPKPALVEGLTQDIQALQAIQTDLVPSSKSMPLDESALPLYLEKGLRYFKNYLALRNRVKHIQTNWISIQKTEQTTRNELTSLKARLNQLDRLLGADPVLQQIAAKESNQLKTKANELSDAINHRSQGTVIKRASEMHVLVTKARQALKRWLSHLQSANMVSENQIASKLEELEKIANLEEPAVIEAQMLISNLAQERLKQTSAGAPGRSKERKPDGRSSKSPAAEKSQAPGSSGKSPAGEDLVEHGEGKDDVPLSDLFDELKRYSHQGQKLAFTLHALNDIENPVLSIYTRTREERDNARIKLANAALQIPETPSWPPTSQTMSSVNEHFEQLEEQWDSLQDNPIQAIWLVSKLSEMGGQYQSLAENAHQLAVKAEQEQSKIHTLEGEILHAMQTWQDRSKQYSGDPAIQNEIHQINVKTNDTLNTIKKNYRQGVSTYDQVLKELYGLLGDVNNTVIE